MVFGGRYPSKTIFLWIITDPSFVYPGDHIGAVITVVPVVTRPIEYPIVTVLWRKEDRGVSVARAGIGGANVVIVVD